MKKAVIILGALFIVLLVVSSVAADDAGSISTGLSRSADASDAFDMRHSLPPRTIDTADVVESLSDEYAFITKWGTGGIGDGEFSWPEDVAVASDGTVYVADTMNDRIQKFTADGTFITKWGETEGWDDPKDADGKLYQPAGVAVDSAGNVYVADTWNDRIQKFTGDGTFITKWGSFGTGDGQFLGPTGIAVDAAGNVYVADTYNDRIQKFTPDGTFITKWGSYGTGDGQFWMPRGVTVDSAGNVYVADRNNHRIQKFD
ncbi:SMP-30/gluconolactonase/LRE family protein, partial [Methanocalculus sp. MSAO_Arc2]|uniref:SMP-30/gluconolactonase/LRE family protein n=1 Tax=Methanocalculus sp. MSAO_Arc2 TaxID=2293855 RepID=UPI003216ECA8